MADMSVSGKSAIAIIALYVGANGVLLSIEVYQGSKKGLLMAYSRAYVLCRTNCSR